MTSSKVKETRKGGWRRFWLYLALLALGLLFGGFIAFANHVQALKSPSAIPDADGIVVWTGKGGGRLETGADLLTRAHGERLLISGVNQSLEREQVLALLNLSAELENCCVDLDYVAVDTIGNARETAAWSRALGYEHIILVTSAYHMPRAENEISSVAGRIRITPYPVISNPNVKWWSDRTTLNRLMQEYGKLLLTYLRGAGSKKQRGTPILETPVDAESN